jgi:hypothetical protein
MFAKHTERDLTNIIDQYEDEIKQYRSKISDYFIEKAKTINKFAENKLIIDFLLTCDADTHTVKHKRYDE